MTTTYTSTLDTPFGPIFLCGDGAFLTGLHFPGHRHWPGLDPAWQRDDESFAVARQQLTEYFAGERREFDIPVRLHGTPFQQRVWQELTRIPHGVTITYAELARRIGRPTATRAVGAANGRNPVSIIVPCHRVISASGELTGYGGGLDNKRRLLELEGATGEQRDLFHEPAPAMLAAARA